MGEDWHKTIFEFYKSKGMKIGIIFVDTKEDVAWERVEERRRRTSRSVPKSVFTGIHDDCRKNIRTLMNVADFYASVENSSSSEVDQQVIWAEAHGDMELLKMCLG